MIRAATEEDLDQIATLYELVARSGSSKPAAGLAKYFSETLFRQPFGCDDLTSLVAERHGRVIGFLGNHVRAGVLQGDPIRIACAGQLVTHPDARAAAPGLFLIKALFTGPQDLTLTDSATDATRRMWSRLGGAPWEMASITWARVLRPVRFAVDHLGSRVAAGRLGAVCRPVGSLIDVVAAPLRRDQRVGEVQLRAAGSEALTEVLPRLVERSAMRAVYDDQTARWILEQVASVRSRGELRVRLALHDGRTVGVVVYYLARGGLSDVLLIAAEPSRLGATLDALFEEARADGAGLLRGRLEPGLLEELSKRSCHFRFNGGALVHSTNPDTISVVRGGDGYLTRLDGEYWMGHHLEPFSS